MQGEITTLKPEFGETPTIDGVIDTGLDEWDGALKAKITVYKNLSNPINGLVMDFWIMQDDIEDDEFLFIAIQFEVEDHSSSDYWEEFVGISISEDDPDDPPEFKDAKIIQFSNITTGEFTYNDYWINDSIYYIDDQSEGEGAAGLEGDKVVYEFSIPVNIFDDSYQDIYLRPLYTYAFNIIYGKSPSYPDGILLSNYKLIEIQFSEYQNPFTGWELILLTLNIVIFGSIGGFYFFYIYRITKLKDKIRRLRS